MGANPIAGRSVIRSGTPTFWFRYHLFVIASANMIGLEIANVHRTHQLVAFKRLHLIREQSRLRRNSVWPLPFVCERCSETACSVAEWVCSP